MKRVSHAQLKAFAECPQRYKFIYIDLLQDKFKKPKPEFTMGQHVHTTLKRLLATVPTQKRTKEEVRQLLRQAWATNRSGFASKDEEAQFGQRALLMLNSVVEGSLKAQPIYLEHYVQCILSDDIVVSGRVDRLDQDSSGAVHLIDYKTSRHNPQYVDKGQLALYSVLVRRGMDLPLVSASYWYLEQNQFESFYPSDTDIEMVIDEIKRKVERVRAETLFSPTPSHVCKWCEFIDICPAKNEAMKIKSESSQNTIE